MIIKCKTIGATKKGKRSGLFLFLLFVVAFSDCFCLFACVFKVQCVSVFYPFRFY